MLVFLGPSCWQIGQQRQCFFISSARVGQYYWPIHRCKVIAFKKWPCRSWAPRRLLPLSFRRMYCKVFPLFSTYSKCLSLTRNFRLSLLTALIGLPLNLGPLTLGLILRGKPEPCDILAILSVPAILYCLTRQCLLPLARGLVSHSSSEPSPSSRLSYPSCSYVRLCRALL